MKLAKLAYYGVADNFGYAGVPHISVMDCSVSITEQSYRHNFPSGSEMAAPHLYGTSPSLPTNGAVAV